VGLLLLLLMMPWRRHGTVQQARCAVQHVLCSV
jgi:hypothetical protein